ncbi:protein of unknown function (plasmid) [Pararobbsia alpina]
MTEPSKPMHDQQRGNSTKDSEPGDPVERADKRRQALGHGDVRVAGDGKVSQREPGSMDASLIPEGKAHPELGPYEPAHDHLNPDVEPGSWTENDGEPKDVNG